MMIRSPAVLMTSRRCGSNGIGLRAQRLFQYPERVPEGRHAAVSEQGQGGRHGFASPTVPQQALREVEPRMADRATQSPADTGGRRAQLRDERQEGRKRLLLRPTSLVSGTPEREKWKKRNHARVERVMDRLQPMLQRLGYDA